MIPGEYARVLFDFETKEKGELCLEKGDVVVITKVINRDWLEGCCRGETGNFPSNFVESVPIPDVIGEQRLFVALESFPATVKGDLHFEKGDIIVGLKQIDANWWNGKCDDRSGIFPLSHVYAIDGEKSEKTHEICNETEMSLQSGLVTTDPSRARALVDYVAQLDEELSFKSGDMIHIKNMLDSDWYIGECNGHTGIFLSDCVEIIGQDSECEKKNRPSRRSSRNIMKTAKNSISDEVVDDLVMKHDSLPTRNCSLSIFDDPKSCFNSTIDKENSRLRSMSLRHNNVTRDQRAVYRSSDSDVLSRSISWDPSSLRSSSYTTENTSSRDTLLTAYGKTLFSFEAESPEEITFVDNEIVMLIKHVDEQWILGEIDCRRGIFPANFVDIIVDCPYDFTKKAADRGKPEKLTTPGVDDSDRYALITEGYNSPESDVLNVSEGETITILRVVDDYWCEAKDDEGNIGYCPLAVTEIVAAEPEEVLLSRRNSQIENNTGRPGSVTAESPVILTDSCPIQTNSSVNKISIKKKTFELTGTSTVENHQSTNNLDDVGLVSKLTETSHIKHSPVPNSVHVSDIKRKISGEQNARNEPVSCDAVQIKKPKPPIKPKPVRIKPQLAVKPRLPVKPKSPSRMENSTRVSNNMKENSNCALSMDSLIQQEMGKALKDVPKNCVKSLDEKATQKYAMCLSELKNSNPEQHNTKTEIVKNNDIDEGTRQSTFYDISLHSDDILLKNKPSDKDTKPDKNFTKRTGQSKFFVPETETSESGGILPKPVSPKREAHPKRPPPITKQISEKKPAPPRPNVHIIQETSETAQKTEVKPSNQPLLPTRPMPVLPRMNPGRVPPKRPPPRSVVKRSPSDLMGFLSSDTIASESHKDLISDIELHVTLLEVDIQKCMESKKQLEQGVMEKGSAEIHENIAFYEANIHGLTDELEKLKETLNRLRDNQDTLDAAKNSENSDTTENVTNAKSEEADRERREERREEKRAELREKRRRVIGELYETEKAYLKDLQLCIHHFLGPHSGKPPCLDHDSLFGNMTNIADLSQRFLASLETTVNETFEQQIVGLCFLELSEEMKKTYAPYCKNHDNVQIILEKNADNTEVQTYLDFVLEKIKCETNVFDLSSLLIKPVQRILKYPLLLNELLKSTEDGHEDKMMVLQAVSTMTDVATAINEYKRGKDLVYKYRQEKSSRIANISFHSLKKKGARIKGRITSSIGVTSLTKDENFQKFETQFRCMEKAIRAFVKNVQSVMDELQQSVLILESVSNDLEDYYAEDKHTPAVIQLHEASSHIATLLYEDFKRDMDEIVVRPLTQLLGLFSGPSNVIQKRFHKLLDYDNTCQKTKDQDVKANTPLFEELQTVKGIYEALNEELLDELPQLCDLSLGILHDCRLAYIHLHTTFIDGYLKQLCPLLDMLQLQDSSATILDAFHLQHCLVVDKMAALCFIPRGFSVRHDFKTAGKTDPRLYRKLKRQSVDATKLAKNVELQVTLPQSDDQKRAIQSQYLRNKLYRVVHNYSVMDLLDVAVYEGDLVGVIKGMDPMGNEERWYIDRGDVKGFVPKKFLSSEQTPRLSGGTDTATSDPSRETRSRDSDPPVLEVYVAEFMFDARTANEISMHEGDTLYVIAKHDQDGNDEWWWVDVGGRQGYVPAAYLSKPS